MTDRIVREPERLAITGVSRTAAWRLERQGLFPARVALVGNRTGWKLSELQAWVESRAKVSLKAVPTEDRATAAQH